MKRDGDGKPLCGSGPKELGARPGWDVFPDEAGRIRPRTGGLSAAPDDPALLPPFLRPRSLGGTGKLPIWVLEVACLDGPLTFRRDPSNPLEHVFIEPASA